MIKKLDPRDTRLVLIIDKLNEVIDAFNEHYHTTVDPPRQTSAAMYSQNDTDKA